MSQEAFFQFAKEFEQLHLRGPELRLFAVDPKSDEALSQPFERMEAIAYPFNYLAGESSHSIKTIHPFNMTMYRRFVICADGLLVNKDGSKVLDNRCILQRNALNSIAIRAIRAMQTGWQRPFAHFATDSMIQQMKVLNPGLEKQIDNHRDQIQSQYIHFIDTQAASEHAYSLWYGVVISNLYSDRKWLMHINAEGIRPHICIRELLLASCEVAGRIARQDFHAVKVQPVSMPGATQVKDERKTEGKPRVTRGMALVLSLYQSACRDFQDLGNDPTDSEVYQRLIEEGRTTMSKEAFQRQLRRARSATDTKKNSSRSSKKGRSVIYRDMI